MNEHPHRIDVIDLAKGFAIISVVLIHAELFAGTGFHDHVINRAVPLFLILFGITAELGFRRLEAQSGGRPRIAEWYAARFKRLLPPVWLAMTAWWLVALSVDRAPAKPIGAILASFAGIAPPYGTSWFVALVIQIVLLFPVLRWISKRIGAWPACVLGAVSSLACIWYVLVIMYVGQTIFGAEGLQTPFYYQWIFAPRVFWQVLVGVALVDAGLRPSRNATWICVGLVAAGPLLTDFAKTLGPSDGMPFREQTALYLLDLPMGIAILGVLTQVRLPTPLHKFLVWCGASSWGIYLGHTVTFESFHLLGFAPEQGPVLMRAMYAAGLLGAGIAMTSLGNVVASRVGPLRMPERSA